jgi:hypothetical protein
MMKRIALLTLIAIIFTACQSGTPAQTPTEFQPGMPAQTPTEFQPDIRTETPIPALVPTLGPLPANSDQQLPFPGYKQENYTDGWNILKDSWNPLWTKWGLMAADQLGPGVSLVVRPVEGAAGIDCEDAVDGSYKGMTLCPPLDVVNGGFLPFPGMDLAANTDYYPLFIQRSSQYARLKSVGTGTSLVLQEVDSAGNPTRYIKPKNDVDGNGGVWVAGEYKAPLVLPAGDQILTSEQLAAKGIIGTGFEISGNYQGKFPMDITVALSKAIEDQYKRVRACVPEQKMAELGKPAEERTQETALLGFYMAYVRDKGFTEDNYSFDKYVADLAAGKDMSADFYGKKLDGSEGVFRAMPGAVEFVVINTNVDPYGNGEFTTKSSGPGFGYLERPDGGLRIVFEMYTNPNDDSEFCSILTETYNSAFGIMGLDIDAFSHGYPIGFPTYKFPNTIGSLNKTPFQINTKYGDLAIFAKP